MNKKQQGKNMPNANNIQHIQNLLHRISERDVYNSETGYSSNKETIRSLFSPAEACVQENYLLQLTVIDSMYSTQMNRRYYGLEELAEALYAIQSANTKPLKQLFVDYIKTKDASLLDYTAHGATKKTNLFSEAYGIGKNGQDKGCAISLISKYAYFATDFKFPIFDSIVCEMYPRIWKYCGFEGKPTKLIVKKDGTTLMDGIKTMKVYVSAIDDLIEKLGGNIFYDHLDRLLWFVGKIIRGNLSLVLTRQEYDWCTTNLKQCFTKEGEFKFQIKDIELKKLEFLKKDTLLYSFFELAQTIAKGENPQ